MTPFGGSGFSRPLLLLGLAAAALWLAATSPAVAADWKREVGDTYPGAMRSVWTLESVAQQGAEWVFAVSFKNGSHSPRTLALRSGEDAAVLLVEGRAPVSASDTDGATEARELDGGATVRTALRFPALPDAKRVTLRTRWVIAQQMAADRYVELEMPVELP